MIKIGLGQDSHLFDENSLRPLILGGVLVSNKDGLKANSDGDVILHSLCNALSSAIGGDSLGTWADEMCLKKGIKDSKEYTKHIFKKVKQQKYQVGNISISVEAKKPRLDLEIIKLIKNKIAELLKINISQVGITFTSGEGLTSFGKGKGIQAWTIVNLRKEQ